MGIPEKRGIRRCRHARDFIDPGRPGRRGSEDLLAGMAADLLAGMAVRRNYN